MVLGADLRRNPARAFLSGADSSRSYLPNADQTDLTRAEKNRRAMNGMPMDAPRSERRKDSERKPMIDLEAGEGTLSRGAPPGGGLGASASESEAGEARKGVT